MNQQPILAQLSSRYDIDPNLSTQVYETLNLAKHAALTEGKRYVHVYDQSEGHNLLLTNIHVALRDDEQTAFDQIEITLVRQTGTIEKLEWLWKSLQRECDGLTDHRLDTLAKTTNGERNAYIETQKIVHRHLFTQTPKQPVEITIKPNQITFESKGGSRIQIEKHDTCKAQYHLTLQAASDIRIAKLLDGVPLHHQDLFLGYKNQNNAARWMGLVYPKAKLIVDVPVTR